MTAGGKGAHTVTSQWIDRGIYTGHLQAVLQRRTVCGDLGQFLKLAAFGEKLERENNSLNTG